MRQHLLGYRFKGHQIDIEKHGARYFALVDSKQVGGAFLAYAVAEEIAEQRILEMRAAAADEYFAKVA